MFLFTTVVLVQASMLERKPFLTSRVERVMTKLLICQSVVQLCLQVSRFVGLLGATEDLCVLTWTDFSCHAQLRRTCGPPTLS